MTAHETVEKMVDISEEVLTVGHLITLLKGFDYDAQILMADETQPIHLAIERIIQASQEDCSGGRFNTVYFQVED